MARGLRRQDKASRPLLVATAVVALLVVAVTVVVGVELFRPDDRERRAAAATYLAAIYAGDGAGALAASSPAVQDVVTASDLDELGELLAELVGPTPLIDVVGTVETADGLAVAGYTGVGTDGEAFEGVVTVILDQGRWSTQDASYRFPDAPDDVRGRVTAMTSELNDRVIARLQTGDE